MHDPSRVIATSGSPNLQRSAQPEAFLPRIRFRGALEYRITLLNKAAHIPFQNQAIDELAKDAKR